MNKPRINRKKYYVTPVIQGRVLRRMAFYFFGHCILLWHAMFLMRLGVPTGQSLFQAYTAFHAENFWLLAVSLAIFPAVCWDMIRLTHRVVGPFVRFERTLKEMTEGKTVEPIKLRKGDLVGEFRDVFNEYIQTHNRLVAPLNETSSLPADEASKDVADPAMSGI